MSRAEAELARVESLRLVRNPALWVALGVTGWWTWDTASDAETSYMMLLGYSLLIPGFVIVLHTILAVLRGRTSGADELLGVVPVGPDRRSLGHGLATLCGGALGLLTILAIYLAVRPDRVIGTGGNALPQTLEIPRPNLAQMLQGPVAVVAVTAFVVALVRWIPTWMVVVPLLFLTVVQALFFGFWFGTPTGNQTWWFPLGSGVIHGEWIGCGGNDPGCDLLVSGFDRATPAWHLAYLAAAAVLFVVVAVLRHRRDRTTWLAFGGSLAAVAALAIVQFGVSEEYVAAVLP